MRDGVKDETEICIFETALGQLDGAHHIYDIGTKFIDTNEMYGTAS